MIKSMKLLNKDNMIDITIKCKKSIYNEIKISLNIITI